MDDQACASQAPQLPALPNEKTPALTGRGSHTQLNSYSLGSLAAAGRNYAFEAAGTAFETMPSNGL